MRNGQTVLVIDDDPAVCALRQRRLQESGLRVEVSLDPCAALERMRRGVGLVLLDVLLPGLDGFEVCRRLKQDPSMADVPVLFLTGSNDTSHKVRAFEVSGQDYITKPINEHELRVRVHSALRFRSLLEERKRVEEENRRLVIDLRKRVTELRTLNLVSTILQDVERDLPELLQELVRLLPEGWAEPDRVIARLAFDTREYLSRPIVTSTGAVQRSCFRTSDFREGRIEIIEVGDRRGDPTVDRFSREEQELLDMVAELLELYLDRRIASESKSRLTSIIEATTDFVATASLDGRVRYINSAGRRMLGLGADESVSSTMLTEYVPEWALRTILHEGIPHAIRDGVWSGSTALLARGGCEIPVSQLIIAHRDAAGAPQYLSTIARDVSEPREAERMLRVSELESRAHREVLQSVISHTPFSVYWKDREQSYRGCNEAFVKHVGLESVDDIIGRRDEDLPWPSHEMLNRRTMDEEVMHAGEPLLNIEEAVECADGGSLTVLASRVPLRDAQGNVIGILGIHADITDRKRVEMVLRESEAKLNAITSQLPAILWTTDRDLNINSFRGSGLHQFGVDASRLMGVSLIELVERNGDDAARVRSAHGRALLGESATYEFRIAQSTFDVRVEPLLDDRQNVVGCIGIAVDVTGRKRAEEIERERRSLQDAVCAMEQVLGVIGHELRTPLSGLRVISELLISDKSSSEQTVSFLRSIHDEVIRLSEMVNNMLDAARVNSGAAKWSWSVVPLNSVCREVMDLLQPLSADADVLLHSNVQPEGLSMNGDRDAVRRLILNLVSNAQKHTRHGSINVRLRGEQDRRGDWICIEVSDTGEGIDGSITDKLGLPFALSAGMVGPTKIQGSGLGLAICKGIASAHGGWIEIESAPGAGTSVHVRLRADLDGPAVPDHDAAILVFREVGA